MLTFSATASEQRDTTGSSSYQKEPTPAAAELQRIVSYLCYFICFSADEMNENRIMENHSEPLSCLTNYEKMDFFSVYVFQSTTYELIKAVLGKNDFFFCSSS